MKQKLDFVSDGLGTHLVASSDSSTMLLARVCTAAVPALLRAHEGNGWEKDCITCHLHCPATRWTSWLWYKTT